MTHADVHHVYMQADSLKTAECSVWNSLTFILEVNTTFNKSSHLLKTNIFPKIWHKVYKYCAVALIQVSLNCKISVSP